MAYSESSKFIERLKTCAKYGSVEAFKHIENSIECKIGSIDEYHYRNCLELAIDEDNYSIAKLLISRGYDLPWTKEQFETFFNDTYANLYTERMRILIIERTNDINR